jgi:hypothetical protein
MSESDISPDEFFNQSDSCYLRVKYIAEADGYNFQILNLAYRMHPEDVDIPQGIVLMGTLVRGLAAVAVTYPGTVYSIGHKEQQNDAMLDLVEGNLSEEAQKNMLLSEPQGSA